MTSAKESFPDINPYDGSDTLPFSDGDGTVSYTHLTLPTTPYV